MTNETDGTDFLTGTVVLLSDDLMFPSRAREALRDSGAMLVVVSTEADAVRAAGAEIPPLVVLVNCAARRYDPFAAIRAIKDASPTVRVVAFAGHVETKNHADARASGADATIANSSVALHLPRLLETWTKAGPTETDPTETENPDAQNE